MHEIAGKRLGSGRGNLDQYQDMFLTIARYVLPRFEQTRVVELVEMDNDEWMLVCSCPFWEKYGWACRHMYIVWSQDPTICDAHVRWHIRYADKYGRDNVTLTIYVMLRDIYAFPGVTVTKELAHIKSATVVDEGNRLMSYFTNSLNNLRLCGKDGDTHWASIIDELPAHLKCCGPCLVEEEDNRARFRNSDDTIAVRDNRGP